jgi:NADH-quinone oxidoreductase subunit G
MLLVGERLASVPGGWPPPLDLAEQTGRKALAWVPRRAGERGALEAGASPRPAARWAPAATSEARDEVARAWGVDRPAHRCRPRHRRHHRRRRPAAGLGALLVGGVDAADLGDPASRRPGAGLRRLARLPAEQRHGIRRCGPPGRAARREGRQLRRLGGPGAAVPGSAGDQRALRLPRSGLCWPANSATSSVCGASGRSNAEMAGMGPWAGPRAARPDVDQRVVPSPGPGQFVLASWHHLLDKGSLQDGEPFLAGTAPRAVARISRIGSRRGSGVADGDVGHGQWPLPVPSASRSSSPRWSTMSSGSRPIRPAPGSHLGARAGQLVTVTPGGAS